MTIAEKLLRSKTDYDEVHDAGYSQGYNKCTEDMQDDLQAKYDEGYENGNQVGVAAGIEQGIKQGKEIGYAEGYAAGKAEAGGGSDTYGVEEMLTRLPFLRKVEVNVPETDDITCSSGLIVGTFSQEVALFVVPPWVTEVQECAFDPFVYWGVPFYAIFLPKTPPVVGWQGMWSSDGGGTPPDAIFVPDEAIEAYKSTTNLAEFAETIKPLSEYNGEGYYGGSM